MPILWRFLFPCSQNIKILKIDFITSSLLNSILIKIICTYHEYNDDDSDDDVGGHL